MCTAFQVSSPRITSLRHDRNGWSRTTGESGISVDVSCVDVDYPMTETFRLE